MEQLLICMSLSLIAGLLASRAAKAVRLPAVTSYLVAGLLLGPFFLGRLGLSGWGFGFGSLAQVESYGIITQVALGFIAFVIGNEFRLSALEKMGRQAVTVGILQAVITTVLVDIALVALHFARPDVISMASAITLGAIASATAPAATLMVVKQYKASGPLTRLLLMVVAIDDAVGLVLFSASFGIANALEQGRIDPVSVVLEPLLVYNRNAPFAAEKWFLAGTMEQSVLLAFSSRVREVLLATLLFTLVLSVLGSLLISARLASPINHLYREVIDAQEKKTFPRLSRTAIREVDRFAETITELNRELVTNSTKFLRIMDMASVELGGYELRYDTGSVYVTKNFFALLGAPEVDGSSLTVRTFGELLEHIQLARPCTVNAEGDKVLTVVQGGRTRYIMLRVTTEDRVQVGLAEDVTAATQERLRIERERDYDVLTGLYNRQAFQLFR